MLLTIAMATLATALSNDNTSELSIAKLSETRIAEMAPAKKSELSFMDDKPVLKVALTVSLPEGASLISVAEPTSIKAKDDTGKDLTDIDARFGGEKQFWLMSFSDDLEQGKVTLQLLPSARQAKTMSLSLTAEANVATGTSDVELAREQNWTKLDQAIFGEDAQYRVSRAKGKPYLDIKPEEVRERIETVAFVGDADPIASDSTTWRSGVATFGFPEGVTDDMTLAVRARTGFQKNELKIEAKDVQLP